MNLNKVLLAGRLTRDPELKTVGAKNTSLAKLGLAVDSGFGDNKKPCFVDATAWGKTAEIIAQNLSKGEPIFVEGELRLEQWDGKDGQKHSRISVNVDRFGFVGSKSKTPPAGSGNKQPDESYDGDDIPF